MPLFLRERDTKIAERFKNEMGNMELSFDNVCSVGLVVFQFSAARSN